MGMTGWFLGEFRIQKAKFRTQKVDFRQQILEIRF